MHLTVLTNLHAIEQVSCDGVELTVIRHGQAGGGLLARARRARRALACDYAVINCSPLDLYALCAVKLLVPFSRCRIVSLDTVLPVPHAARISQRLGLWVKKRLFRQVHLFIEYFKDTQGYETHYAIPRDKFRYVPFKINRYEQVRRTPTRDGGYIFCGGNTRRDFRTLIEAARGLPYPFKIVTMPESVIEGHGSSLDESTVPPNVEIIRHDGSDSFLEFIAAARLVALPIVKENISASGIGVYLASMALGKCVVISEGPAVNGVVPEGAVMTVKPEDPIALREAIRRVYLDDHLRESIADAGRRYALSLKGEARLCESVVDVLLADRIPGRASVAMTEGV